MSDQDTVRDSRNSRCAKGGDWKWVWWGVWKQKHEFLMFGSEVKLGMKKALGFEFQQTPPTTFLSGLLITPKHTGELISWLTAAAAVAARTTAPVI